MNREDDYNNTDGKDNIADDDFEIEDLGDIADIEGDGNIDDTDDFTMEDIDGADDVNPAYYEEAVNRAEDFEEDEEYSESDFELPADEENDMRTEDDSEEFEERPRKKGRAGLIGLIVLGVIVVFAIWAVGTKSGKSFCMGIAAKFIHSNIQTDDHTEVPGDDTVDDATIVDDGLSDSDSMLEMDENGNVVIYDPNGQIIEMVKEPRSEEYVKTYLIFGIESIDGAANTDAIMLVSINTKDNTIKMTSILRDTYVNIPGWDKNKLNSAYAKGAHGASTGAEARRRGAALLIRTIEETFDVKISGYASVGFDSFEKIIDRLGGLDIELGEKEAKYLNTTNYISKPENRNVSAGWNHLNGNQVMGYVRVRKVETLGGVNNDYGRTTRQRRVISAIIKKYKSSGILDLISITKDCLGYVHTNLTEEQIKDALTLIVNNGIYTTDSLRLPIEGGYYDSGKKGIDNGSTKVTYTLVMEGKEEDNIKALHQFLFLDPETETETETAAAAE